MDWGFGLSFSARVWRRLVVRVAPGSISDLCWLMWKHVEGFGFVFRFEGFVLKCQIWVSADLSSAKVSNSKDGEISELWVNHGLGFGLEFKPD
ncbi:unnamed protein product [Arabis nemorensis]|uniref:Uncharacterized protein n=1 Tax=Arabis nemorensis TaxID=586526 RepID=A0A565C3Y0_9BRAS|nr:unnamed protein product [Arabis nemorensis]